MKISDLETYEQLQMEAVIQGMTIPEFVKKYFNYITDNKYFIIAKRIFAFNRNYKFITGCYNVKTNFDCTSYMSLISLEGAPTIVKGYFSCANCKYLTTLKGAPIEVYGNFNCNFCDNLTSLEGAPKKVGRDFCCCYCEALPNKIKRPKGVKGNFYR